MAFLEGPRGSKNHIQSQNSQKIRKSQSETDQKVPKNDQKMVKSPFGNDILEVKKAYFWVSKNAKKGYFRHDEGQNHQNRKIPKAESKSIAKSYTPKNKTRGF